MAQCCFVEGYKDFPVCNHVREIGPENIGYQTGMFDDGLPFEVEEYEYGEEYSKIRELALIMPDLYVGEEDCDEMDYEFNYEEDEISKIEGFHYEMELKECCVLPIGMVFRGQEDNFTIISWYQKFLESMGIVEYISDLRSCSVFYYTDINGNDLVQIRTGLITNGKEEAVSHVELRNFPNRKSSNKRNNPILKVVK